MTAFISTLGLPILQSIIASRMDSAMDEWVKQDDASNEGRFCQIMKQAFIAAVKKVKGDTPKMVKDHVDELFDECRNAIVEEFQTMQPAKVKAYVGEDLYNAFKEELEKNSDAIPYINENLLITILQQSKNFVDKIQELCERTAEIQKSTESILAITQKIMGGKGLSVSKIVPYTDKTPIVLPSIFSERHSLVDELESLLKANKALVLYAGVQEGKTVASRLLASRFQSAYQVIEIDLAYYNELNLKYVINSYDSSANYLFVLDGVQYDSEQYEAFCTLITHFAHDNRLFIINCYDKISDQILDDAVMLAEKDLPPLTKEDVQSMIPQTGDGALVDVVFGLSQGQPFLTNAICSFLKTKDWKLTGEELEYLFTFSHGDSLKKKVRLMLRKTVNDANAYNLLNRLMVVSGNFSKEQCAGLASINPILSNPHLLLDKLLGTWVIEENGKYHLSGLLRKTIEPDLLPQEVKDCYNLEANRYLQKKKFTPADVLVVLNCLVRAGEIDKAAGFYVLMLMKLRDSHLLDVDGVSLLKAIWIGVPLPSSMGVQMKLVVRCIQLIVLKDLDKQNVDGILEELSLLLEKEGIDKGLRTTSIQALAAYCLLHGYKKQAILFQQKILALSGNETILKAKEMALFSLSNVENSTDLYEWLSLYVDLNYPQDDMFSEGALVIINKIYDSSKDDQKTKVLKDVLGYTSSCRADIYTVVCAAKLIDHFWQNNQEAEARMLMKDMPNMVVSDLGEILLNYSYGLGLYHHGYQEEAYSYLEKAARGNHIEKACMVAMNARCTFAQIVADKGQKEEAAVIIREVVNHPNFSNIFSLWEQDIALSTLAYALWENGQREEAVEYLLRVEGHLWTARNNEDADYVNMSLRYVILVLNIHANCMGMVVDDKYAKPDYGLFVKPVSDIGKEFKPERNFTKEQLLYDLAERYADEDAALTILEHMLVYQREDAAGYARLLSVMVQAIPLCLKKDRKDIVEYVILTVLKAPVMHEEERKLNFENFVLTGSLLWIVAYRAECMMNNRYFDEEWFCGMMDKVQPLSEDSDGFELMKNQIFSSNPQYGAVLDLLRKEVVCIYHFKRVDFFQQLVLLWRFCNSLAPLSNEPSAQQFLKAFVLDYARFLIKENPDKFNFSLSSAESLFFRIARFEGMDYVKKKILGLYFYLSVEVVVSEDMKEFLYD